MDAAKIVSKISKEHGIIKNVYFLACGGSLVDLPGILFCTCGISSDGCTVDPCKRICIDTAEKTGKGQSSDYLLS